MIKQTFFSLVVMGLILGTFHATFSQQMTVDPLTGKGNLFIPVHSLRSGAIEVPIGLFYSAGGVKIEEGMSNLGYTWRLEGDGAVYREVRGIPDDALFNIPPSSTFKGWLHTTNSGTLATFNFNQTEEQIYSYINGLTYKQDSEPDLFTVSAPGLHFSFVFDNNKQIRPLYHNEYKISYVLSSGGKIEGFEVINDRGVKYSFYAKETLNLRSGENTNDYLQYRDRMLGPLASKSYTTSWKLTQITDASNNTVHFEYDKVLTDKGKLSVKYMALAEKLGVSIKNGLGYTTQTVVDQTGFFDEQVLTRIHSKTGSVDFIINYLDVDMDETPTPEELESYDQLNKKAIVKRINVYAGNYEKRKLQRFYDFTYSVIEKTNYAGKEEKQVFLRAVQEGAPGMVLAPYLFTYNGIDFGTGSSMLEPSGSDRTDLWGYPSFENVGAYPKIYVYETAPADEFYSVIPKVGVTPTLTINGANRSVDTDGILTGSLTRVDFPAGGHQDIYYEPNTFYDSRYYNASTNSSFMGAGIRVRKLVINDGVSSDNSVETEYEYLTTDGKPSGRISYLPQYAFSVPYYKNPSTGAILTYDQLSGTIANKLDHLTIRTSHDMSRYNGSYVLYSRVKETVTNSGSKVYLFNTSTGSIPAMYGDATANSEWNATQIKFARPSVSSTNLGFLKAGTYTYPFSNQTNYDFERGKLSRVLMYNGNNQLVAEELYTYNRIYPPGASAPVAVKAMNYDVLPSYYGTSTSKMYAYGTYTLLTGLQNVTTEKEEIVYNPVTAGRKLTTTHTFHYSSPMHTRLSERTEQGSDGTVYKTQYKYPKDYSFTNPVGDAAAIQSMKDKNILSIPIEQTTFIPDGGTLPGNPASINYQKVLSSGYSAFTQSGLPSKAYILKNTGAFTPTYASGGTIVKDNDYVLTDEVISYDSTGVPLSTYNHISLERSGRHTAYGGTVNVLSISGAYAENVIYSCFDSPTGGTNALALTGTWPQNPWQAGRTDAKALQFAPTAGRTLNGILTNTTYFGSDYTLVFYYKSSASATLTLKVKSLSNGSVLHTQTIALTSSASWKRQAQKLAPGYTLPDNCLLEFSLTGATLTIDDVLIAPEAAVVQITNYNTALRPSCITDSNGLDQFIEYDEVGRTKLVRDMDGNIRSRTTYDSKTFAPIYSAYFSYESCDGNNITYTATPYTDTGVTYKWSFDGSIPVSGTYQSVKTSIHETVTLQVFKAGVLQDEVTQRIDFSFPFSICVDGPTVIDYPMLGSPTVVSYATCVRTDAENSVLGPTLFTLNINEVPCTICQWNNAQYQWRYKKAGKSTTWVNIGSNSPSVSINLDFSYSVQCLVTSVCGSTVIVSSPVAIQAQGKL